VRGKILIWTKWRHFCPLWEFVVVDGGRGGDDDGGMRRRNKVMMMMEVG